MKSISVRKESLIERLVENREKHKKEFNELNVKYHSALRKEFEDRLNKINAGINLTSHDHYIRNVPVPENHTDDYTRAIDMLNWDENDRVELNEDDFRRYIQDDWDWRGQFEGTKFSYSGQ